jgi:hypothetical protein
VAGRWPWGDLCLSADVHILGTVFRNFVRGMVLRFTVFFVVVLFACELLDRVSDLGLGSSSWAFISIARIFFRNAVGQAPDSREDVRIAVPWDEHVITCYGAWSFGLVAVGRRILSFARNSGAALRCLAWPGYVGMLSCLWFRSGFSLCWDLLIACLGRGRPDLLLI